MSAYEDDPRTAAELAKAWAERPSRDKAGPLSFDKFTEIRGALFGKLHCPESICKPKGRP